MNQFPDAIELFGVKTNNLKNISCRIPLNEITVLTGVSGSGKSSLAFDTLFAEGQRRFFEAMSTYSRMFLDEMPKPPIDKIENCLPAIALRQQSSFNHPRSTVASVSELLFYLAQLYANAGTLHCPCCGGLVGKDDENVIQQRLTQLGDRLKIVIYARVNLIDGESAASRLEALTQLGYQRLWDHEKILEFSEVNVENLLSAKAFDILIDRVIFKSADLSLNPRLCEAIEEAYRLGDGVLYMDILGDPLKTIRFKQAFACQKCGEVFAPLRAEMFDPNSTIGACPVCTGFGRVACIDWKKVIAPINSLEDDAIRPLATPSRYDRKLQLLSFCERQKIPTNVPFASLKSEQQELVLFGKPPYKGVMGFFDYLQSNSNKFMNRILMAKYRGYQPCLSCDGTGFSSIAAHVTVLEKSLYELMSMSLLEARNFFDNIPESFAEIHGLETPVEEIQLRLRTLCHVGLGYLTLNRQTKTLSGGECQRLHLGCGLGRGLSDTLYVLDEPTAGLHSRDSLMLVNVIESLRDLGNTIVVVEHDTDVIQHADHVIELGPCGGEQGGHIIFEGSFDGLLKSDTPSGRMFRSENRRKLFSGNENLETNKKSINEKSSKKGKIFDAQIEPIKIIDAYANNLDHINVTIPTGKLVTIAGVSGSGKSSLIRDVLYGWVQLMDTSESTEESTDSDDSVAESFSASCKDITGLEQFDEIVMMQQQSLGRSARSSILTVSRAFTEIRELFAKQREAQERRLTASAFSFNSPAGRCALCEGLGYTTVEMLFMSDIRVPCKACSGHRYNDDVLHVYYKGKTIYDVTQMTVTEAVEFFTDQPKILKSLTAFIDVGLGYVRLGQPSSELSGGEFQRFKLATYLERPRLGNTLFIFDEPTVGLHMQDVSVLISALRRVVQSGASVLVVEHNLDFIAQSDHVIELGPDAGPDGGHIVFQGTPAELIHAQTLTAKALLRVFE